MIDATAIILTKNEEVNICECINSIKDFVKRIVIVDSGSTDKTVELAKSLGVEVYQNKFVYYAQQFNWGIENTGINTEWILRIDADERFTEPLWAEIEHNLHLNAGSDVNGYTIEAWYFFLGTKMKFGSMKRKMMMFKAGIGRIEDRKRDAHSIISSGTSVEIKEKFLHHDFKDLNDFVARYNWYATREAQDYLEYKTGKRDECVADKEIQKTRSKKFNTYYRFPKFLRAFLWFFVNYIFRGGFLNGMSGFIYHVLSSFWYRFLVDAKIYEYEKGKPLDDLKAFGE